MAKKKDVELGQMIRAERSRGRRNPVTEETLEIQRQIRKIGNMLKDEDCLRTKYITVLRDFGLKDESERFRKLLAVGRFSRQPLTNRCLAALTLARCSSIGMDERCSEITFVKPSTNSLSVIRYLPLATGVHLQTDPN